MDVNLFILVTNNRHKSLKKRVSVLRSIKNDHLNVFATKNSFSLRRKIIRILYYRSCVQYPYLESSRRPPMDSRFRSGTVSSFLGKGGSRTIPCEHLFSVLSQLVGGYASVIVDATLMPYR